MSERSADAAALDLQAQEAEDGFEALENLEQKISLAIAQLKRLRTENARLREENSGLERRVSDQNVQLKELRGKFARLENERANIKTRVERLIGEVDAIALDGN